MGFERFRRWWKRRRMERCSHSSGYNIDDMETYICAQCGTVVTPFGLEIVTDDARKRFPEFSHFEVEKWMEESKYGV